MPIISYKKENIENASERFIFHGCNTLGIMGAGAAKAIKNKWPRVFENYKNCVQQHSLGDIIFVESEWNYNWKVLPDHVKMIGNMLIQDKITGPQPRLNYKSLEKCLNGFWIKSLNEEKYDLAFTKIGCGLAGGDWNIVSKMIDDSINKARVIIYEGK